MSTGVWHWCLERGGLPEDLCIQTSQARCLELLSVYQCYTYFHYLCKRFKRAWRIVMPCKTLLCACWASSTLPFISHSPVLHAVTSRSLAGVSLFAGQTRCLPYDRLPLTCERPAPRSQRQDFMQPPLCLNSFSYHKSKRGTYLFASQAEVKFSLHYWIYFIVFLIISKISI